MADRIIVLDQGRVVEQGTHRELVATGGYYAKLREFQLETEESAAHAKTDRGDVVRTTR